MFMTGLHASRLQQRANTISNSGVIKSGKLIKASKTYVK